MPGVMRDWIYLAQQKNARPQRPVMKVLRGRLTDINRERNVSVLLRRMEWI